MQNKAMDGIKGLQMTSPVHLLPGTALRRALKQGDIRIKCDNKNQPSVLYFQFKGTFSE